MISTLKLLKITLKLPFRTAFLFLHIQPLKHQGVCGRGYVSGCVSLVCLGRGPASPSPPTPSQNWRCSETPLSYLEVDPPYFSTSTSLFKMWLRSPWRKPHSVKTKHSWVSLSYGKFNSLAVEKAVTEIFQINKANKLLQEEVHIYMIYNTGSWPTEAGGTQWTSSKPEATQALGAASKVLVHVQPPTESSLGVTLFRRWWHLPASCKTYWPELYHPVSKWVNINRGEKIGILFRGPWQQANREKKNTPPKSMFALLRASLGVHWKQFRLSPTVKSPCSLVCQPGVLSSPESTGCCCWAVPDPGGKRRGGKCSVWHSAVDEWWW